MISQYYSVVFLMEGGDIPLSVDVVVCFAAAVAVIAVVVVVCYCCYCLLLVL